MATIVQAAKHIDLGERRFRELVDVGVIKKAPRGEYDLDKVRLSYIRHIRKQASDNGGRTLNQFDDRRRLEAARAEVAELELAERKGELLPIDKIKDAMNSAIANVKVRLMAIPTRAAPLVNPEAPAVAEKVLSAQIKEALEEISGVKILQDSVSERGSAGTR